MFVVIVVVVQTGSRSRFAAQRGNEPKANKTEPHTYQGIHTHTRAHTHSGSVQWATNSHAVCDKGLGQQPTPPAEARHPKESLTETGFG